MRNRPSFCPPLTCRGGGVSEEAREGEGHQGECLWGGGEAKSFFSGPKCPPGLVAILTLIFNRFRGDLAAILQSALQLRGWCSKKQYETRAFGQSTPHT